MSIPEAAPSAHEAAVSQLEEELRALPDGTEATLRRSLSKALLEYQATGDQGAMSRFADELIWTLRMHSRQGFRDAVAAADAELTEFDESKGVDVADYLKVAHERRVARRP